MKPLSERIKEFDNAQFVDWLCLACVDVREVRTPDDAQKEINNIRAAVTERLARLSANRLEEGNDVADYLAQFSRARLLQIIVTGPDASGAEQNSLARIALALHPDKGSRL